MRLGDFIGHNLFSIILCLLFRIWDFGGRDIPMSTMGESLQNNKRYGKALGRTWRSFGSGLGKFFLCS